MLTETGQSSRGVVIPALCTDLNVLFSAAGRSSSGLVPVGPTLVYSTNGAGIIDPELVLAEEMQAVVKAITTRRQAFGHGRACARAGLRSLGLPDLPILRADDRSPTFPSGVTASITHTTGFVAAAVAPLENQTFIGIDAERIERTGLDVSRRILTAPELERIDDLQEPQRSRMIMSVFSAKEALYKAQHQTTHSWLGFNDVEAIASNSGWEMRPHTSYAEDLGIRWPAAVGQRVSDGLVVSAAVCVAAPPT